ncbi:hypothetical protein Tco_1491536 [Tanacetum coccineum]
MEAHLAPKQPIQVNKITSSCEHCRMGPHDTQYWMENPEQAFVDASSYTDEAGGLVSNFMASQDAKLSKFEAYFKQQQGEITNKIDTVLMAINDRITRALPSDTVKNPKLNVNSTSPVLSTHTKFVYTKDDGDVMFIEIIRKYDDSQEEGPEDEGNTTIEGLEVDYFNTFPKIHTCVDDVLLSLNVHKCLCY